MPTESVQSLSHAITLLYHFNSFSLEARPPVGTDQGDSDGRGPLGFTERTRPEGGRVFVVFVTLRNEEGVTLSVTEAVDDRAAAAAFFPDHLFEWLCLTPFLLQVLQFGDGERLPTAVDDSVLRWRPPFTQVRLILQRIAVWGRPQEGWREVTRDVVSSGHVCFLQMLQLLLLQEKLALLLLQGHLARFFVGKKMPALLTFSGPP